MPRGQIQGPFSSPFSCGNWATRLVQYTYTLARTFRAGSLIGNLVQVAIGHRLSAISYRPDGGARAFRRALAQWFCPHFVRRGVQSGTKLARPLGRTKSVSPCSTRACENAWLLREASKVP